MPAFDKKGQLGLPPFSRSPIVDSKLRKSTSAAPQSTINLLTSTNHRDWSMTEYSSPAIGRFSSADCATISRKALQCLSSTMSRSGTEKSRSTWTMVRSRGMLITREIDGRWTVWTEWNLKRYSLNCLNLVDFETLDWTQLVEPKCCEQGCCVPKVLSHAFYLLRLSYKKAG